MITKGTSLESIPVDRFGGLNLRDDPLDVAWSGAVDLLNVDFDRHGRLRTRDGYDNFTANTGTNRYRKLWVFPRAVGGTSPQVLASTDSGAVGSPQVSAISFGGASVIASHNYATENLEILSAALGGDPGSEFIYFVDGQDVIRWDGTTFTTPASQPAMFRNAWWPAQNRHVGVETGGSYSKVLFSNAGDPETWGADDFVELSPGDGEMVTALVPWREQLFAFKGTKFFVFYGATVDATGGAIFNYRPVDPGAGAPNTAALGALGHSTPVIAAPPGVFFLNHSGIWRTQGGPPELVSAPLNPLFRGGLSSVYGGDPVNHSALHVASMAWMFDRLYVSVATGSSSTNNRLFVWDSVTDAWTIWDIPAAGVTAYAVNDLVDPDDPAEMLLFSYATGSNHIGYVYPTLSSDDGTAIASHYTSGRARLANGQAADVRDFDVYGTGTVTLALAADGGSLNTTANGDGTVGGAVSTALVAGLNQVGVGGNCRDLSWRLSATSGQWRIDQLAARVQGVRNWT